MYSGCPSQESALTRYQQEVDTVVRKLDGTLDKLNALHPSPAAQSIAACANARLAVRHVSLSLCVCYHAGCVCTIPFSGSCSWGRSRRGTKNTFLGGHLLPCAHQEASKDNETTETALREELRSLQHQLMSQGEWMQARSVYAPSGAGRPRSSPRQSSTHILSDVFMGYPCVHLCLRKALCMSIVVSAVFLCARVHDLVLGCRRRITWCASCKRP